MIDDYAQVKQVKIPPGVWGATGGPYDAYLLLAHPDVAAMEAASAALIAKASDDALHALRYILRPFGYPRGYELTGRLLWMAARAREPRAAAQSVWTAAAAHASFRGNLPEHWRGRGYDVVQLEAFEQMNLLLDTGDRGSPWHHTSTPHQTAGLLTEHWLKPARLYDMEVLGRYQSWLFRADYALVEIVETP